jgi:hypothetical protein
VPSTSNGRQGAADHTGADRRRVIDRARFRCKASYRNPEPYGPLVETILTEEEFADRYLIPRLSDQNR